MGHGMVYFAQRDTPIKMGIYGTSSTLPEGSRLGMKLVMDDGRVFHLCKAGASNLAAGKMCQGAAPVANHLNCVVAEATAVEAKKIKVTLGATAATADQYAEGTLHVNDVDSEGYIYKVKTHLAIDASASGYFELYDPVAKALTTSSEVTLTKNLFDGTIVVPAGGLSQVVVGVPIVDVTASYYYWSQTEGPAAVLTQGVVVIGQKVGLGGTADGACGPVAADVTATWGWVMRVNASTDYSLIFLTISP
ncbi:MAG: hypothetical protein AB1478_05000 [Nitrospirota bacterium]